MHKFLKNILSIWLVAGLVLAACIVLVSSHSVYAQNSGIPIKEIRVNGVERIEPTTVLTYLDLRVGDRVDQAEMDRALKNLFSTGLFADVSLNQRGPILEVTLVENPIVNQVAFEGNDDIDDEELLAEVQIRPRQVFTRTKVQADVTRLHQLYQRTGRFSSNIEPKIIKLDQNRVDLVFEIDEGPITKIGSIRFVGNKKYDDDKLRSEIVSKESRFYRFLSSNDRYDPDRLEYDKELLRRYYLSQGYADFRIISAVAELSKDRDFFFLTFTVDEGDRYKVGKIDVVSKLRDVNVDDLFPHITLEEGEWYNADEMRISVDRITDALGDLQFAFVNVKPEVVRDRDNNIVDITFYINEAPRVFVERVDINGNVRTLDRVIRRELEVVEGDPFSRTLIAKSEQQIRDLGYFENVTVTPRRGSTPDQTVVDIDVTEQSTGELSLGAGFSTSDGPLADVRLTERNLLGKGQILQLSTVLAGERTQIDLSFTEPYFLNRDFSAGFDVFHVVRDFQDESSFDQTRTGGAVRFGYPLSEKWRQTFRYRYEYNDISDVDADASLYIREQQGKRNTSAISQRITYDDRDSKLLPTNGLLSWIDTEFAGIGGDAQYISGKVGSTYYYPIADQWVFNILGEAGAIGAWGDTNVRINERYFLGGGTLRGFEDAGVGPRDLDTDDALGGNYFYRGTAELSLPLGLPEEMGIKGHIFTDVGSLFDVDSSSSLGLLDESSLRASGGIGISWRSPLGPIRADFSKPYMSENFDKEEVFRFNFGTSF